MHVTYSFTILAPYIGASVIYSKTLEKTNLYSPTLLFLILGIVRLWDMRGDIYRMDWLWNWGIRIWKTQKKKCV